MRNTQYRIVVFFSFANTTSLHLMINSFHKTQNNIVYTNYPVESKSAKDPYMYRQIMNNKHFWMKQFIHRIVFTCNYLVVQKWYAYNFKIISLMISNNIVQKENRWSLMIYFFITSGDGLKTLMMQLRMKSCSEHIWMRFCMPTNLCWFLF